MSNVDPTLIPTHSELSDEKIEASLRGESSNPVFEVAKKYIDMMRTHDPASTDRHDALVTELILSSPYTLDVLTLIAIWAEGLEDPARSGMSRGFSIPLIAVHTLFDPTNEESVAVVYDYIKTGTIGESAMSTISAISKEREVDLGEYSVALMNYRYTYMESQMR